MSFFPKILLIYKENLIIINENFVFWFLGLKLYISIILFITYMNDLLRNLIPASIFINRSKPIDGFKKNNYLQNGNSGSLQNLQIRMHNMNTMHLLYMTN